MHEAETTSDCSSSGEITVESLLVTIAKMERLRVDRESRSAVARWLPCRAIRIMSIILAARRKGLILTGKPEVALAARVFGVPVEDLA
jgi:hypothetical protein